jgi:hypothetical protein
MVNTASEHMAGFLTRRQRLLGLLTLEVREFRNLLVVLELELSWDSAPDKQAQIPTLPLLQARPGNRSGVGLIRAPTTRIIGVVRPPDGFETSETLTYYHLPGYYGQQTGQQGTGDIQMQGPQ